MEKLELTAVLKNAWKKRDNYHGMYGTKFYNSWRSIKTRCNGSAGKSSIKKYKDKGIIYCNKWNTFKGFYEDMFDSYIDGFTVDRIDNSKGYYKENCRWANQKTQQNNRTNNVLITYNNETKTIREWSDTLGVTYNSLKLRYYKRYLKGIITVEQLIEFKK